MLCAVLILTCSGTVGFMAPEVMKREQYTFTADWYSFGCLCCQLVHWYWNIFVVHINNVFVTYSDIPFKPSQSSDQVCD